MQSMVKSSQTSQKLTSQNLFWKQFPEIRKYLNSQNKPAIQYIVIVIMVYVFTGPLLATDEMFHSLSEKPCEICYEPIPPADTIDVPCGHNFCRQCWAS